MRAAPGYARGTAGYFHAKTLEITHPAPTPPRAYLAPDGAAGRDRRSPTVDRSAKAHDSIGPIQRLHLRQRGTTAKTRRERRPGGQGKQNRREFIMLLGGAAAAWPLVARAQQPGRVYRIGVLETSPAGSNVANFDALRKGLRELGYVEGQNLVLEYRSADGRPERFPQLAAELLSLNVDLIVTRGTPAVMAAKNATGTIPVVMAASGEPVGTGVVAGLARPGGNVTGLSALTSELVAKRLELMRETVAGIRRIAFLQNIGNPVAPSQWEEFKTAAPSLVVKI
jgi:hypothetical protein